MTDFIFYRQVSGREYTQCAKQWERIRAEAALIRDEYEEEMEVRERETCVVNTSPSMEDVHVDDYYYLKWMRQFWANVRLSSPLSILSEYMYMLE